MSETDDVLRIDAVFELDGVLEIVLETDVLGTDDVFEFDSVLETELVLV